MNSLKETGIAILGILNLVSQSIIPIDKRDPEHVNCKTGEKFKELIEKYFAKIFMFSMNDEVVHTGHHKMEHYLFALSTNPKLEI